MARIYNYKKIQEMREMLLEEIKPTLTSITTETLQLIEMRIQTMIMAGLFDDDIKEEVPDKRPIDVLEAKDRGL